MKKSYEVGYCKPPKETQFQKGQSGNSKGRPKRDNKDIVSLLEKELNSQVTLADGQSMSKEVALVKQLTNKAIKGDTKSQQIVINLQEKGKRRTLGERLHDKLIERNYLDADDITDFLTENKILPVKDLCGTTYCHLTKKRIIKELKAAGGVIDAVVMTEFMRTSWRALYMCSIAEKIITEYKYWDGIDKLITYVAEEKRKVLIKKLSKGRYCARPPKEIYKEAIVFNGIGKWLILRNWRELIDANKMFEGFAESEKEFLSPRNQEKLLKDLKKEIPEETYYSFEENFHEWVASYQSEVELPTTEECQKHIFKYAEDWEPISEEDAEKRETMVNWYLENANEGIDIPFPRT